MQIKPSIIAVFAAMLTVAIAAPKPASDGIIKREAAPEDATKDYIYYHKSYAGDKRDAAPEDATDYIYYHKNYAGEKRSAAPAQEAEEAK